MRSAGTLSSRAVVFDLGKVLLDFDYNLAAKKLAETSSKSAEAIRGIIDQSPLLLTFETGRLTSQQFYEEVRRSIDFRGALQDFSATFADIFKPIEQMVDLHKQLRERGVPTYVFSNTNPIAIAHIRRQFPFFERFDGYVLSFEHGAMKPETAIYEKVEELTGKHGQEIVYIDDRPENIDAANVRGWQGIHHLTPDKTIHRIKKLELL